MKKGVLFATLLLPLLSVLAQTITRYEFEVKSYDDSAVSAIEVFDGDTLLGSTDAKGQLVISRNIQPKRILLKKHGVNFDFSTTSMVIYDRAFHYYFTLNPVKIEEIIVQSTRAGNTTPTAKTEITKEEIAVQNT